MPFMEDDCPRGQQYGNADRGSKRGDQREEFLYPGYNELLTGGTRPSNR